MSPLRIALLDDHTLIREAMKIRLALEPDFKVVDVYASGRELLEGLEAQLPDLLVLDYQLTEGEIDGLRLLQSLRARHPDLRILIFSSMDRPATINLCIRAGARGFVGKTQPTDELLTAIRTVAMDRTYLPLSIAAHLEKLPAPQASAIDDSTEGAQTLANYPELSPKEREVLRCILDGMSGSDVASKFARSRKTISGQKHSAYRKLGISSDAELFKLQTQLKGL
ncbi:response regulator transcription factor [Pseudomonas sp. BW16M2]|uniref:response regulator transcription factor n=1 Tax=Pseudomonas sp. BW16M2 TaxID=2745489 RepID=UPI001EE2894F|nr:response regulator transcription factor [Pseudomonas sp. BW16M2]